MKCNLDCSYCGSGLYGGHDNSTKHPSLDECLHTVDFMFRYVDLYMQHKPKGLRYVVLNVYGGESLFHPHIVDILTQVKHIYRQSYATKWHLTVTTTTNAIVPKKKLQELLPLIDEFTVSYHSENSNKQKKLFKDNLQFISANGNRIKCIILIHADQDLFSDSQNMIEWCKQHEIIYLPRQLDHYDNTTAFNYTPKQVVWFDKLYKVKSYNVKKHLDLPTDQDKTDLSNIGRACCGGRSLCKDQAYKSRHFYTENKFPDWYCSVNEFFLYIKQVTGEIFTNKDCKMNFASGIGPIGSLKDTESLLQFVKTNLDGRSMPIIQCKKTSCWCGLCAPKAQKQDTFVNIMEKYHI